MVVFVMALDLDEECVKCCRIDITNDRSHIWVHQR